MKRWVTILLAAVLMMSLMATAYAAPDRMTTYLLEGIDMKGADYRLVTTDFDALPYNVYDDLEADLGIDRSCITEIVGVELLDYTSGEGTIGFSFVNDYVDDLFYGAVAGVYKDGDFEWKLLAADEVNGDIDVEFTADALEMLNGQKEAVVCVLVSDGEGDDAFGTSRGMNMTVTTSTEPQTTTETTTETITTTVEVPETTTEWIQVGPPSANLVQWITTTTYKTETETSTVTHTTNKTEPGTTSSVTTSMAGGSGAGSTAAGRDAGVLYIELLHALSQKAFDDAYAFTSNGGKAVDFFGADVRAEIAEMFPDMDPGAFEIYEAVDAATIGYRYEAGNLIVDVGFPETFESGHKMVTVAGSFDSEGGLRWTPLATEAVGGKARITFTQNIMTRMETEDWNILFILYQP